MAIAPSPAPVRPDMPLGVMPTPFYERLAALNHYQSWENWNGYAAPSHLDTVEAEYFATRSQATLFDLTPMCKFHISGPDAERVLNRLVTRDVRKLKPGRVGYAVWCDEEGGVIDDGTIFRYGPDDFIFCSQDPQLAWLNDTAWGCDVSVRDVTGEIAALALQGPTSCSILKTLGVGGVETLRPFAVKDFQLNGFDLRISRTGFTGDLGYELWTDNQNALALWDGIVEAAGLHGVRAMGSEALEMVRIEAGFILPHTDFLPANQLLRTNRAVTPFELGLDWLVSFDKPHYNGKRALLALSKTAPKKKLVMIEINGDKPADGSLIYHRKNKEVGMTTSALWSPTTKRNIALAWLEAPHYQDAAKDLWIEIYLQRELRWERLMKQVRIIDRPVFNHPRRSTTPPADF
ncbi:MAG: aminomethyltransferase family protein [Pseudomonadota bacterium]